MKSRPVYSLERERANGQMAARNTFQVAGTCNKGNARKRLCQAVASMHNTKRKSQAMNLALTYTVILF